MPTFGKKKTFTDYIYTKVGIVVLVIVAGFLCTAVYKRYVVAQEMSQQTVDAQTHKQQLLERKSTLEAKVQYLSGDRGTEEEVRKDFDVVKPGEQVIILTGTAPQTVSSTPVVAPVQEKPWYQFW